MKAHHEKAHAFQTVKEYNRAVTNIEFCKALLVDEDINGVVLDKPFEDLVSIIKNVADDCVLKFGKLNVFLNRCEQYALENHTNRSRQLVLGDKTTTDSFVVSLKDAVSAPQIKDKTKLSQLADSVVNPLDYLTPVQLETPYHYAVMMNDWLDASSYTMRGINQANGQPLAMDDKQKRAYVRGALGQFDNLQYSWPVDIASDITKMWDVRNYVLANLDSTDLLVLAKHIDDNIEKLPLLRRLWAL